MVIAARSISRRRGGSRRPPGACRHAGWAPRRSWPPRRTSSTRARTPMSGTPATARCAVPSPLQMPTAARTRSSSAWLLPRPSSRLPPFRPSRARPSSTEAVRAAAWVWPRLPWTESLTGFTGDGLKVTGGGVTICDLAVRQFPTGIRLSGGTALVSGSDLSENGTAVVIAELEQHRRRQSSAAARNVISGNFDGCIDITAGSRKHSARQLPRHRRQRHRGARARPFRGLRDSGRIRREHHRGRDPGLRNLISAGDQYSTGSCCCRLVTRNSATTSAPTSAVRAP